MEPSQIYIRSRNFRCL